MNLRLFALLLCALFAGCALHEEQTAYRTRVVGAEARICVLQQGAVSAACEHVTPEVSTTPPYVLHYVEFDDQGWPFPAPGDPGYLAAMGSASAQIDAAIDDLEARLKDGPVQLVLYVHGWKHSAYYLDSDVQKFREILTDVGNLYRGNPARDLKPRQVVGIYIGWRGNSFPSSEPWSNVTFWSRKNAALRVATGSSRELFARIRALRTHWHPDRTGDDPREPRFRAVTIAHSFGAQIAYASLSPSILADLAIPIGNDRQAWRLNRLRQTMDLTVLLNPAFEASAYEPLDRLARRFDLQARHEPPVLVTVTSTADVATGRYFPLGRTFSTLAQRTFVSAEQEESVRRTPGFVERYHTHVLDLDPGPAPERCGAWRPRPAGPESTATRSDRDYRNVLDEIGRHTQWVEAAGSWRNVPDGWSWNLCGGTTIARLPGRHADIVWNVRTSAPIISGHNDITGDAFTAFLRQLYLDVVYPPGLTNTQQ